MLSPNCPKCSAPLSLVDLPRIGEQVNCPSCEDSFEVVWLFPLELTPVRVLPGVKTDSPAD